MSTSHHTRFFWHSLAWVTLAASASALAQDGPPGRPGEPGFDRGGPPPAEAVARLAANYEQLAAFDTNRDGALDDAEQQAVGEALANGRLQGGFRGPPPGFGRGPPPGAPDPARIATRAARMYERVAPFDANQDGVLDAAEQAALRENLPALGPPGGRGPGAGAGEPELIWSAPQHRNGVQWPTRI